MSDVVKLRKKVEDKKWLGGECDQLGIVQKIYIWPWE